MRICISSLPIDTFGGAERVVLSDAQRFADDGNDVHMISDEFDQGVISEYGLSSSIELHEYEFDDLSIIPNQLVWAQRIRSLLKRIKPDIVIAHYREKATWLALSTLQADIDFVTHVHGSILWFENKMNRLAHLDKDCLQNIINDVPGHSEFWGGDDFSLTHKYKYIIIELIERKALQSCDEIFVNTQQVSQELECLYDVDTVVNPPGVNLDLEMVNRREIPVSEPFILSVSRLDSRKRISLLIRSFSKLKKKGSDVRLVIGGTGEEEDQLKQLVAQEGIEESVDFVGFIEEDLIASYYSKAEIFACPGWMSYGLTPLEAVQTNTKVALSTDTFAKEVIGKEDGVKVLSPDVDAWVEGLNELLNSDNSPSAKSVPTVEQHTKKKLESLYDL